MLILPHPIKPNTRYWDKFLSMNSERVGSLFGRLLKKQYPQLEFQSTLSVSLDDLLEWSYWPSFIKIHSMCFLYSKAT